ncbi:unnamed protein product [Tuber melanosporum]|jgi:hypothetical protein|uniref:(Perigord truffle) hypothetical protein n=1 Tax=Tuber melanosporum (strain Mel28) TaxID=656061 RepID=D5GFU4_TUBMM|nr:uncharacterized protein GSTUM_00007082001 [Tuber melanosporum]CAZ83387.1 unnamed protein product [Tuber melanosporum]
MVPDPATALPAPVPATSYPAVDRTLVPISTNVYLDRSAHTDEQEPADPDLPFLSIPLPGESTDSVPVYDSCDELRRKIRAFFRNPKYSKVTQKKFREAIGNVNANTYRRFMEKKGETAGAECGMFYGSYVFFEKMRVYEGKAKGVRRVRSEIDFSHGRPMIDDNRRGVWVIGRAPAKGSGSRRKGWY